MRYFSYLVVVSMIICTCSFGQARLLDSLHGHMAASTTDSAQIKDMLAISEYYVDVNTDSSLKYASAALSRSKDISHSKLSIAASSLRGRVYDNTNKYDKALECKLETSKLAQNAKDTAEMIQAYSALAQFYGYSLTNNTNAINYSSTAIDLARKIHHEDALYNELGQLSNYYFNSRNYDKALTIIEEQLAIAQKNNDKTKIGTLTCGIGDVLRSKGDNLKCIEYYDKGIGILEAQSKTDLNNLMLTALSLENASLAYINLGRRDEAIEKIQRAVKIFKYVNSEDGLISAYARLVNIYISLKRWKEASSYNASVLAYYKANKAQLPYMRALQNNAEILFNTGEYRVAYQYLDSFITLKASIQDQASQNHLAELEASVAAERKQSEIDLLTKDKQYQSKIRIFFVAGLIALVIVIIIILSGWHKNRIANRLLKEKNNIIGSQKAIMEEKNTAITDSIVYARKIQNAILPNVDEIKRQFPQSFILYKPKDIVSGDFYWTESVGDTVLLAACDCTGHGVPGALVAAICHNALSRAVLHYSLSDPGEILDKTTEIVAEHFSKGATEIQDGMDISLLAYNKTERTLKWAGANNPIWIVNGNALQEIKGDKNAIGNNYRNANFNSHEIAVKTGDKFYLFSDGFADQFGGAQNKKLQKKNFKELLVSVYDQPMDSQLNTIEEFIKNYQGEFEQTDDILVIGVALG